jgi:hypothetical protein
MRAKDDVKVTFKLIQLFLFLLMYVHTIGCVWFLFINSR